ncbi:MAG: transporter substrate-binding domain-containing protein [Candidatus Aminicenantes bacterium]|nr:transporter substrate-binding domain-containing protein [Candidatus Aminicenantes bacterium]
MRRKHVVCGLVVVALVAGVNTPAMAQIFPWWSFDSVLEEIQDRGTIKVGLGLFAPWSLCNNDGELVGFEIDVAKKLAADIGVEVEFARTNWSYVISSLIAEDFDAIISGMAILPHRNLRINFTSSYNQIGIYLVANTAQTADLETLADFNSSESTIGTRRGASSIPAIENVFPDAIINEYDTDNEVLEAVVAGTVDAAAAFANTGPTWVEANPDALHLPSEEPFALESLAMGVRKGDLDTLNFLNSWIRVNEDNGWLEQRRQYWFEGTEWEDQRATDTAVIEACDQSFL